MRVTNKGAAKCITDRVNFDANSMSGRWETRYGGYGQMPRAGRVALDLVIDRNRDGDGVYIVYSYATPIAWYDSVEGVWYYVDHRYSVTTTNHQRITRMAIDTWDGNEWANDYVTITETVTEAGAR